MMSKLEAETLAATGAFEPNVSIHWRRGQTYNIVIFGKVGHNLPLPFYIFKKFVCIGRRCCTGVATEGAWDMMKTPRKLVTQEPWCNPQDIFEQISRMQPNHFRMKDVEDGDANFLVQVLEGANIAPMVRIKDDSQELTVHSKRGLDSALPPPTGGSPQKGSLCPALTATKAQLEAAGCEVEVSIEQRDGEPKKMIGDVVPNCRRRPLPPQYTSPVKRWRAALEWVRAGLKQDRINHMETAKHAVESRKRAIKREQADREAKMRAAHQESVVQARERKLASHLSGPTRRVAWAEAALSVSDAAIRKSKKEIAHERKLQASAQKRERDKLNVLNEARRQQL